MTPETPPPPAVSAGDFDGLSREETIAKLRRVIDRLTLEQRFTLLHELGIYRGEESRSGDGSSLAETRALRLALPPLLRRHGVKSLLDVPCGDHHWMQQVDLTGIDYLGADIVPQLVDEHRQRFAGSDRRFQVLDVCRDQLPTVDLILCRDLLIHLSLEDMQLALDNFAASGSRLLLTSHFPKCEANVQIESGDYHPVNLCEAPFDLPPPLEVIDEESLLADGALSDRSMALWNLEDLRRTATSA